MPEAELLRKIRAAGPPLEADGWWSLSDTGLALVLANLAGGRRRMVECGSGASTVLAARLLRELGAGHVWALEHDPEWAERARSTLAAEHLDGWASVVEAPLSSGDCGLPWYDRDALAGLPESGVDLLLVDGPPAGSPATERARYPALPLLADRLADGATVIVDDADRPGERWAIERWRREHGFTVERDCGGLAVGSVAFPLGAHERVEDSSR